MHSNFIHLRNHTSYSLSEGAVKPEELVELCIKHHMPAVAITDSRNLFCALEFSSLASKKGVQPIIGCTLMIENHISDKKIIDQIVLYAANEVGYRNLLALVSKSFIENENLSLPHIKFRQLKEHASGIMALTAGRHGSIGKFLINEQNREARLYLDDLANTLPGNLYIELNRHGRKDEEFIEPKFLELAYEYNLPIIATNQVFFASRKMYEAHDALLCIADGRYIVEENRRKLNEEYYFKTPREMETLFKDLPEAIENTINFAKRCSVKSEEHQPMLPNFVTDGSRTEDMELRFLSENGLRERIKLIAESKNLSETEQQELAKLYLERLEYELNIIINMKFAGYFLIVSDFIRWSKRNNIPVGPGRGSGAGSVVAWSLEITDLDPIRFGLLFERFLNPERVSMPDFDIDFCQERRDEVIHYVQNKYGKERVAQIITFGKLQARAVIRDVGRVLQMSYTQVDRISKLVPFNAINPVTLSQAIEMEPALRQAKEDPDVEKLLEIALKLEGLNRHASTHAAGIVIAGRKLIEMVPLYFDPKSAMYVVQYSMKYAEAAGLVKFDFLGLKTLTVIAKACQYIKDRGIVVDILHIPLDDKKTYEMLSNGDSIGVFQFESPGMRDTLRKMRPDSFEDLIALGALYRPGPMDNIPTYIACKHGIEKPNYLHPNLEKVLKETFGVIIYQEQVMEIAQILAGYSLGAADLLRRAMGKKIKAEMDAQRELFVNGATARGVDKSYASEIFDLVAKFAGYGFNKSHAAAYALISYQTAYLKANFPLEFLVASMNLDINDTDKISIFAHEAKYSGIEILPPNINLSDAHFKIEDDKIRYGMAALKNVGENAVESLILERKARGKFKDIFDFAARADSKIINKRQLEYLIKSGAFDSIFKNRNQLFESIDIISRYNQTILRDKMSNQMSLFALKPELDLCTPTFKNIVDWSVDTKSEYECDAIGFYFYSHPLDHLSNYLRNLGILEARDFKEYLASGFSLVSLVGIIMSSKVRMTPRGRFLSLKLADASGVFEISVFDEDILTKNRKLLDNKSPVFIQAEARRDEGGIRLTAQKIIMLDDYIGNKKPKIIITLTNLDPINLIKELCEKAINPNAIINLIIEKDGKEVTLALPENYKMNIIHIGALTNISGVQKVEVR